MKVKLNNPWYINEQLHGVGIHDFPKEYYDLLPSSAEIQKGEEAPKVEEVFVPKALKDFDTERSQGDREQAFVKVKK